MQPSTETQAGKMMPRASFDGLVDSVPMEGILRPKGGSSWRVAATVVLLAIIFAFAMIDRAVLSVMVGPVKGDLALSDFSFSLVQGFAIALFYVILALPFGWAADRFDSKYVLMAGVVIWSVATASCAFAANFSQLFAARAMIGAGEAALGPCSYPLIASLVSRRRLPSAIMLVVLGGACGSALGQLVGGALLGYFAVHGPTVVQIVPQLAPWRLVFLATGLPGLLLAGALVIVPRPVQRGDQLTDRSNSAAVTFGTFLRGRVQFYVGFIGGTAFQQAALFGAMAWNTAYVTRKFNMSPSQAGVTFGAVLLLASVVAVLGHSTLLSRLAARKGQDVYQRWQQAISFAVIPVLLCCYLSNNITVTYVAFAAYIMLAAGVQTLAPTALQLATPSAFRSRISAVYVICATTIGVAVGPALIGFTTDAVFGGERYVGYSIALCGTLFNLIAIVLFRGSLRTGSVDANGLR